MYPKIRSDFVGNDGTYIRIACKTSFIGYSINIIITMDCAFVRIILNGTEIIRRTYDSGTIITGSSHVAIIRAILDVSMLSENIFPRS